MRAITITEKNANKRIDRFLKESFPKMPVSAIYKAFRNRDIKVNGIRIKEDYKTSVGDKLEIYIIDDILDGLPIGETVDNSRWFSIVYEDKNIIIVNKQRGIPVHPDGEQSSNTLIDLVQSYLKEKKEINHAASSFAPSLCHRLDRNTGGLVIIAKNSESLKILLDKIKNKEVKKYYQCLVKGKMHKYYQELTAYLIKDENKSKVFISSERLKGSLQIITRYKVLSYENDISRLEVELVTGRTHQIRAHLASIGHPIIGDGKYGTNAINRPLGAKTQALWAYKIVFDFETSGILDYLNGREFEVEPEFDIDNNSHLF